MTKWIVTRGANGTRTCYHTTEDCRYLNGTNYRPVSDHEIEHYNLNECSACAENANAGGRDKFEWYEVNDFLKESDTTL